MKKWGNQTVKSISDMFKSTSKHFGKNLHSKAVIDLVIGSHAGFSAHRRPRIITETSAITTNLLSPCWICRIQYPWFELRNVYDCLMNMSHVYIYHKSTKSSVYCAVPCTAQISTFRAYKTSTVKPHFRNTPK